MTISEKILYCRKRCGLSQEALAEKIGVSRQAISKWETGEATPELSKLALLAKTFGVTADWLISEEDPPESFSAGQADPQKPSSPSAENWASSLPGTIGNLVRRYGWLAGVYIALGGLGIAIIGIIAKIAVSSMFKSFGSFGEMGYYGDFSGFGGGSDSLNSFATNNPVSIMATAMIIIGIVITAAGAVLAFYLKNKGKGGDK